MEKMLKIKNIVIIVLFVAFIGFMASSYLWYDAGDILSSERREPAEFPEVNGETLLSGQFGEDFEDYLLDNTIWRDGFRKLKARLLFNVFYQKDNGGIYVINGIAAKMNSSFSEGAITAVGNKMSGLLYNRYFKNCNVYYSVIADKNYYLSDKYGYPSYDYEKMIELFKNAMNPNMEYIGITDILDENDFYKTDLHWDQKYITDVAKKLGEVMGFEVSNEYTENVIKGFYGGYYGQSALPLPSEDMTYLTNAIIDGAKAYTLNNQMKFEEIKIYDEENFLHPDPYDFFLAGPQALIKIVNPANESGKRLIMFRDSFGSNLAPLLIEGYSEVYLVDLRYASSTNLFQTGLVPVSAGDDVLFMYSTEVLVGANQSLQIK